MKQWYDNIRSYQRMDWTELYQGQTKSTRQKSKERNCQERRRSGMQGKVRILDYNLCEKAAVQVFNI